MILDSDVLIDILRRHQPAVAWFASLSAMPPTCGVAALELVYGARDSTELAAIYNFLALFTIIWPDTGGMNTALFDLARYKLSTNLGLLDGLIAATALSIGEPLATFNTKHFSSVPDLSIVQQYVR